MGIGQNLLSRAARRLELPLDVMTGVPRIELVGQDEFSMEPHRGLMAYSLTRILVKSGIGPVAVTGQNMTVRSMNDRRIVISGTIQGVEITGGQFE